MTRRFGLYRVFLDDGRFLGVHGFEQAMMRALISQIVTLVYMSLSGYLMGKVCLREAIFFY